jgi:hypothetical protein
MKLTFLALGMALSFVGCGGSSSSENQPKSDAGVGGSGGAGGSTGGAGGTGGIGGIGGTGGTGGTNELTQFNAEPVNQSTPYTAGGSVSIETIFGNVRVEASSSADLEVVFQPFDYQGYQERSRAVQQMNEDLQLTLEGGSDISIKALRTGAPNPALGVDITVRLPAAFDGKLTILNHGDGILDHFDTDVSYVGSGTALDITSQGALGDCKVQGAATVVDTSVECGSTMTVLDVSDSVHLNVTNGSAFDEPSMIVRLAAISSGSGGGTIETADGSVEVTFPASANFSAQANAPNGAIDAGAVPATCTLTDTSATAKSVSCGSAGPSYTVSTQGENGVFAAGTIYFKYQ